MFIFTLDELFSVLLSKLDNKDSYIIRLNKSMIYDHDLKSDDCILIQSRKFNKEQIKITYYNKISEGFIIQIEHPDYGDCLFKEPSDLLDEKINWYDVTTFGNSTKTIELINYILNKLEKSTHLDKFDFLEFRSNFPNNKPIKEELNSIFPMYNLYNLFNKYSNTELEDLIKNNSSQTTFLQSILSSLVFKDYSLDDIRDIVFNNIDEEFLKKLEDFSS